MAGVMLGVTLGKAGSSTLFEIDTDGVIVGVAVAVAVFVGDAPAERVALAETDIVGEWVGLSAGIDGPSCPKLLDTVGEIVGVAVPVAVFVVEAPGDTVADGVTAIVIDGVGVGIKVIDAVDEVDAVGDIDGDTVIVGSI